MAKIQVHPTAAVQAALVLHTVAARVLVLSTAAAQALALRMAVAQAQALALSMAAVLNTAVAAIRTGTNSKINTPIVNTKTLMRSKIHTKRIRTTHTNNKTDSRTGIETPTLPPSS